MLDKAGHTILNDLRWHWEDHYKIDYRDGAWTAVPTTALREPITRATSAELREALRHDYAERAARADRQWAGGCSA